MKYNIETELIGSEIGFLRPKKATWKTWAEDVAGAITLVVFAIVFYWLVSIAVR